MGGALDKLEFTTVPGTRDSRDLRLYALSTCAFCRKAMNYLQEHGHQFRYIYLDQIDLGLKRDAKQELRKKYESLPVFPILTIDDNEALSGFVEDTWASRLNSE